MKMQKIHYLQQSLLSHSLPKKHLLFIIEGELSEYRYDLPLERFAVSGGWPDAQDLEIEPSIEDCENGLKITVKCYFDEVRSTGCSDIRDNDSAFGELIFFLDTKKKEAYICEEVGDYH